MGAGDITVLGPYVATDRASIDTALTGQVVVADKIVAYPCGSNQVMFVIVKAA
jgi:hypothetical protein